MTKISRYFLTAFLKPLTAAFGALTVLVLMADLMERLDNFIAGRAGPLLVAEYLLSLAPLRAVEVLPVAALLAALFSLGALSRRQELTAAMAGGLHPWRCVQSLLAAGALLSLLCWGMNEFVIPPATRHAKRIWTSDIRRVSVQKRTIFNDLAVAGRDGTLYFVGRLDTEAGRMENVLLDRARDGRPFAQVQARSAEWAGDQWIFRQGAERYYEEDGLGLARQEAFSERKISLPEAPEDLIPREEDTDILGRRELGRRLKRLKALGVPTRRQEVELHMKLALPWANLIVLFLGIPFAFRRTSGKVRAVGVALGTAFLYFGLMQVGRAFGQKPWCPPSLAAWLANLLFMAVGGAMFWRMRKLS